MRSWKKRNVNGRSGELFRTALLLLERRNQQLIKIGDSLDAHEDHLRKELESDEQYNKIDTDDESRGHIKGNDSSDAQPLGMKDIDDHDVKWQGVSGSERTIDLNVVLFI